MNEPCVGSQYFRLRPACLRLIPLVQLNCKNSLLESKAGWDFSEEPGSQAPTKSSLLEVPFLFV